MTKFARKCLTQRKSDRDPQATPPRPRLAVVLAAPTLIGAMSLAVPSAALAGPCSGLGAPIATETRCLTAIQIPGNPLRSFDISWVNADRSEYYLSDRSNAGIDVINTQTNSFVRTIRGFMGAKLNAAAAVNNSISGPHPATPPPTCNYARTPANTLHF